MKTPGSRNIFGPQARRWFRQASADFAQVALLALNSLPNFFGLLLTSAKREDDSVQNIDSSAHDNANDAEYVFVFRMPGHGIPTLRNPFRQHAEK
jgi:hypothetical protein